MKENAGPSHDSTVTPRFDYVKANELLLMINTIRSSVALRPLGKYCTADGDHGGPPVIGRALHVASEVALGPPKQTQA